MEQNSLRIVVPENVPPGYVIGRNKATLKKFEQKLLASITYVPERFSIVVTPGRGFIGEAATRREYNVFFAQGAGKKPPAAERCVNSDLAGNEAVRVVSEGRDYVCTFDDAVTCETPGDTAKRFRTLYKRCLPRMTFGDKNKVVKIQVRFGKMKFFDPLPCDSVAALRKSLAKDVRHSFLTEVRIESEAIFDAEPVQSDLFVISLAYDNQPFFVTLIRQDNQGGVNEPCVDLGNGFCLLEVCIGEEILGRLDTLNSGCPDIRIQIQEQVFASQGKIYDTLLGLARQVRVTPDGFMELPIKNAPAGYDLFHVRRKQRSRYVFGDFVWDVSHVRSWDYSDGFQKAERFEVELYSKAFKEVVLGAKDKSFLEKINWEDLLNNAWELSRTF